MSDTDYFVWSGAGVHRITYLVNLSSGVVHKLVDGRAFESDNIDQIEHQRVVPSLEDVGAVTHGRVRFCRRCFPPTA